MADLSLIISVFVRKKPKYSRQKGKIDRLGEGSRQDLYQQINFKYINVLMYILRQKKRDNADNK